MGASPRAKPEKLAAKLAEIRNRLEFSQGKMAHILSDESVSIRKGDVSRYENGLREPSLIVLLRYARLVKVPMDVLVDDKLKLP